MYSARYTNKKCTPSSAKRVRFQVRRNLTDAVSFAPSTTRRSVATHHQRTGQYYSSMHSDKEAETSKAKSSCDYSVDVWWVRECFSRKRRKMKSASPSCGLKKRQCLLPVPAGQALSTAPLPVMAPQRQQDRRTFISFWSVARQRSSTTGLATAPSHFLHDMRHLAAVAATHGQPFGTDFHWLAAGGHCRGVRLAKHGPGARGRTGLALSAANVVHEASLAPALDSSWRLIPRQHGRVGRRSLGAGGGSGDSDEIFNPTTWARGNAWKRSKMSAMKSNKTLCLQKITLKRFMFTSKWMSPGLRKEYEDQWKMGGNSEWHFPAFSRTPLRMKTTTVQTCQVCFKSWNTSKFGKVCRLCENFELIPPSPRSRSKTCASGHLRFWNFPERT